MKKMLCACLLLVLIVSLVPFSGCVVYVSETTSKFGFNNNSYLGFRDDISFDDIRMVEGDDSSFPDYVFFIREGATDEYGFYCDNVNVTVNNYFASNVLELDCVASSAGAVYVYVGDKGAPVSRSGGDSVVYSTILKVVTIVVSSPSIVQLSWNPVDVGGETELPAGGGGGGTDTTPTITPTFGPAPSSSPSSSGVTFTVEPIFFGPIEPNITRFVNLRFQYGGSSFTLQSLSLPEPFNSWYVPATNFSSLTYILNTSGSNYGEATILFNLPDDVVVGDYSGTFTLSGRDGFGSIHTSTGTISTQKSSTEESIFSVLLEKPLYLILIVIAVVAFIFILFLFMGKKRRRK